MALVSDEQWLSASDCLKRLITEESSRPDTHVLLARCLYHLGDLNRCEREIFAGLKLQPNHVEARGLLQELRRTRSPHFFPERTAESRVPAGRQLV